VITREAEKAYRAGWLDAALSINRQLF
jgi:hypothetical protein